MFTLNCKGRLLAAQRPLVMGILNITPDSFYGGSRITEESLLTTAATMIQQGATILDIGGQSTRPGSSLLTAAEEMKRVIPAIEAVAAHFPGSFISVDTFYAVVAEAAINAGASMVNDISAGTLDTTMIHRVAQLNVPYICMHMKGTPQNMNSLAFYDDVVKEVLDFFIKKVTECRSAGIKDIIIDPGFGFAKNTQHNFQLLKQLKILQLLECPVLAGLSRKSSIYKTLGITAEEALNGTTVLNTIALQNGATILRVHDVKEAIEAVTLFEALKKA